MDVFLSSRIKRMSRALAAKLVRSGMVARAGVVLSKPATRVFAGELLTLQRKKLDEAPIDDVEVPIIYEDPRILAVSKPGDLVVHPTASAYHRTLIRVLRVRRGEAHLDLAHRIDKETSGLVLCARDPATGAALKDQFASRRVKKGYLALVVGVPAREHFTLDAPMRLVPDSESSVLMEIGGEGAMPAVTEVSVLAAGARVALVEARPLSGRQHQIRLHLAHAGHPILGDKLYLGGEELFLRAQNEEGPVSWIGEVGHHRQALHAHWVRFVHPDTRVELTLHAPLAPDLVALAARHQVRVPASALAEGAIAAPPAPPR